MTAARWYLVAFLAIAASLGTLIAAALGSLRSIGVLQISIGCSALAGLAGLASLAAGRNRR